MNTDEHGSLRQPQRHEVTKRARKANKSISFLPLCPSCLRGRIYRFADENIRHSTATSSRTSSSFAAYLATTDLNTRVNIRFAVVSKLAACCAESSFNRCAIDSCGS